MFSTSRSRRRMSTAGGHHRRPRTNLQRHQSRRHQGAAMFRGRRATEANGWTFRYFTTISMAPRSSSARRSSTPWNLPARRIDDVKIVTSGAGAAALACLDFLVVLGAKRENIFVADIEGVVTRPRGLDGPLEVSLCPEDRCAHSRGCHRRRRYFSRAFRRRRLEAGDARGMGARPLIMALANPNPEIVPEERGSARPDAMICTGRSDFPNQVNNVLCFPYIFRGALDVAATAINEAMKLAAVRRSPSSRMSRHPTWSPGLTVARRHYRQGQSYSGAFRSTPDPAHRAGGRQGRDGYRRREEADRRFRAYEGLVARLCSVRASS